MQRFVFLFALITVLSVSPLFAASETVEITGTVYAVEWDNNNHATAVIIATEGGEEVIVAGAGVGGELLNYEEKQVKAVGTVAEDEQGRKILSVTQYNLVE